MAGKRILVIEDDVYSRELGCYLLRNAGHEVRDAYDGELGVVTAREFLPDLVVCDLQLPGINGFAVLKALRNHPATAGIPVVAVTASSMVGDREQVMAAGFDGYVSKPVDPRTFPAQMEAFLSGKA